MHCSHNGAAYLVKLRTSSLWNKTVTMHPWPCWCYLCWWQGAILSRPYRKIFGGTLMVKRQMVRWAARGWQLRA